MPRSQVRSPEPARLLPVPGLLREGAPGKPAARGSGALGPPPEGPPSGIRAGDGGIRRDPPARARAGAGARPRGAAAGDAGGAAEASGGALGGGGADRAGGRITPQLPDRHERARAQDDRGGPEALRGAEEAGGRTRGKGPAAPERLGVLLAGDRVPESAGPPHARELPAPPRRGGAPDRPRLPPRP